MIPINNSDTAWLIVADYNQDNSIGYPDFLRDDVNDPEVDCWSMELYQKQDKFTGTHRNYVGAGSSAMAQGVGRVGCCSGTIFVGETIDGRFVGGYDPNKE